jgi:hypothetical protein
MARGWAGLVCYVHQRICVCLHACMCVCMLPCVSACKCLLHVCSPVCAVLDRVDRAIQRYMSSVSTQTYGGLIFRMFSHFTSWKNSHFFSSAAPDLDPSLFDGSLHSCACVCVRERERVGVCVCVCVSSVSDANLWDFWDTQIC